jgi:hypothetical protein
MKESDWTACTNPEVMLAFLRRQASARKLQLFACACCRRIWHLLSDRRSKKAVEVAESFADGLVSTLELEVSRTEARAAIPRQNLARGLTVGTKAWRNARVVMDTTAAAYWTTLGTQYVLYVVRTTASAAERRGLTWSSGPDHWQCCLLRDIFGNQFHQLSSRPEAAAPLAERVYEGDWSLMPLLGEWLQEHGYWSEGEHCLDPNIHHVKGCWVVDWVTGRE